MTPAKSTLCSDHVLKRCLETRERLQPVSVIVPIKDYEELLERVEDAEDIAWLRRARRKPLHYRPLEVYLAERRQK